MVIVAFILGLCAGIAILTIISVNILKDYEVEIDKLQDGNLELMKQNQKLREESIERGKYERTKQI